MCRRMQNPHTHFLLITLVELFLYLKEISLAVFCFIIIFCYTAITYTKINSLTNKNKPCVLSIHKACSCLFKCL